MDFDNPRPAPIDVDAPEFRASTLSQTQQVLQRRHTELRGILQAPAREPLHGFIVNSANELDRTVVGASPQEDITSTPDTAIMHAFGLPIWRKPQDAERIESENLDALIEGLTSGQVDTDRFGKGVYFAEVLSHKYKNGNGRVARGMKLMFDKGGEETITEDDTRAVLGVERESLTQTGEHSYRININPDFERLVLGVAYFGLQKGLSEEQVINELKLNGKLPEEGLQALAQRFGTTVDKMKEEYMRFMIVDSDLGWCDFSQQ